MSLVTDRLEQFQKYVALLKGDEKGEAQVFCDRLFLGFGHKGYKEAGAELEYRIKKNSTGGRSFADLVWKPRVLIEMKKRGENLYAHYKQAFEYWIHAVPNRPRYVVLCNFDQFWIYDFDKQIDEPVDIVTVADLAKRYTALNFLFRDDPPPIFKNDLEAVSRDAADKVASLFNRLIARGINRSRAQRFVLQMVVAMFSEDIKLLPAGTILTLADDCMKKGQSSYDLFGGLFTQMNTPKPATGGRFKDVPYFNGGVFQTVDPIDLTKEELALIASDEEGNEGAARKDWSKVNPAIFGAIFQQSMDAKERHAYGAHFTSEADIMRIVIPTITRPWQERIDAASNMKELLAVRSDLMNFKVLDPACGSGNFLYVAYREMVRIEIALMTKLKATVSEKSFEEHAKTVSLISPRQFFGIDRDTFGVELAKVTLMLAKKLALDEAIEVMERDQIELSLHGDDALPLDNLDANVLCNDALFCNWPMVDAIIGNPPYQSKNKIIDELGRPYVNRVRRLFPDVSGRADYCVYWFRKAHDELAPGQYAGLVGTNTIRQNYSRISGLDYIVNNGGTLVEAVSTQVWSGDAVVHVSIANWVKGDKKGKKTIFRQVGDRLDSPWELKSVDRIGPSLSFELDVSVAQPITANSSSTACYQGQTHGHEGFLLTPDEAVQLKKSDPGIDKYVHPFLITDDLIGTLDGLPSRYVIDFEKLELLDVKKFPTAAKILESRVLADRTKAAKKEKDHNDEAVADYKDAHTAKDHENALKYWWRLFRGRGELLSYIEKLDRYIVCGRVTKRPIFAFVEPGIRPNDSVTAFPLDDDYSFGILQSGIHWQWFVERCSTLKSDPRYTSNTVFDSFPWPQTPTPAAAKAVAEAAVAFRECRSDLQATHDLSLRELYRTLDKPGASPFKDALAKLDAAVRKAYGMAKNDDALAVLLDLNLTVVAREAAGQSVVGPGIPPGMKKKTARLSDDVIKMP